MSSRGTRGQDTREGGRRQRRARAEPSSMDNMPNLDMSETMGTPITVIESHA